MASVAKNRDRNCRIREREIEDGFRVTLYPALMDLELENNNMICAVKEIYTKFAKDRYIDQRVSLCKATLIGNLVVDMSNIVERQIDIARKAKEDMVTELKTKFLEVSKILDTQVKKLFPTAGSQHNNFVENRVKNFVFEYNRKAEEDRLRQCEFQKKKLFNRVSQKQRELFNPEDNQDAVSVSHSNSDSSGQPVAFDFKSKNNFLAGSVGKILDNSSVMTNNPTGQSTNVLPQPVPQPVPQPEPELSDEEFKKIVASTKLSDPQQVEVDGLSGFSYVWQLHPQSPESLLICADQSTGHGTIENNRLRVTNVQNWGQGGRLD